MAVSLAVGLWPTRKMMPLNHTSKAPALGEANHVYQVTLLQEANIYLVTTLDRADIISPEFAKIPNILQALEMSLLWRAKLRLLHLALNEAYLYSIIAVLVMALHLSHHRGTGLNNAYCHCLSVFLKQLRHAYFSANNAWKHGLDYSLISISTPDAKSS